MGEFLQLVVIVLMILAALMAGAFAHDANARSGKGKPFTGDTAKGSNALALVAILLGFILLVVW